MLCLTSHKTRWARESDAKEKVYATAESGHPVGPRQAGPEKTGVAPRTRGHHGRRGREGSAKGATRGRTGAKTLQPSGYYLTGDIAANETEASSPGAGKPVRTEVQPLGPQ